VTAGAVACARAHPTRDRLRAACISLFPGALGSSGAVNGVLALFALANPQATVLVYGILPVPAFILGGLSVLQDLRGVSGGGEGGCRGGGGRGFWGPRGGPGGRGGGVGVEGEAGALVRSVVWLQGIFIFSFLFCCSRRRRRLDASALAVTPAISRFYSEGR